MTILLLMGLAILFGLAGLALVLYQIRKENRGAAVAGATPQAPVRQSPTPQPPATQSPITQSPATQSNANASEDHG